MKFESNESKGLGSQSFIKLKDKERISGVFAGDPFTFRDHWTGQRGEMCTANGGVCKHCENGNKPKFRFHLNFITKDQGGGYVPKIFAGGWTVYSSLKLLNEEYDLSNTIVSITRNGNGTDTTYLIMPTKESKVSEALQAELAKIQLLELDPSKATPQSPKGEFGTNTDEIPF